MGLVEMYRGWCQKQYDVWGSKLQAKYDFWKDYDDPELRKKCQEIWKKLSPGIQKKIYELLVEALEKYGPDFAKNLMAKLSEAFIKIV